MNLSNSISFLESRRWLNLLLIGVYYSLILLLHNPLVNLSIWLMQSLSLPTYDIVVGIVILVVVIMGGWIFWKNLRKNPQQVSLQIILGIGTLLLLYAHSQNLSVMNIESIHFLQFMFLTWLVFPLFRQALPTLLITLLFAFGDELFQYLILYPERESYLDLNDVVMDVYGMGMGLLFLLNAGVERATHGKLWRSPALWAWAVIGLGLTVGLALGWVSLYADPAKNAFFLFHEGRPGGPFWQEYLDSGVFYHVLRPAEGLALLGALLGFYSLGVPKE